jgi:hypothetical protein
MIIGKARRPVSSRIVPYRIVPSSVAETLPDRCDDVAEPLHEGLLIEHLEGQHDQDDHGKWAAARAAMTGSSPGDAVRVGKLVAKFGTKTTRRPFAKPSSDPQEAFKMRGKHLDAEDQMKRWQKGLAVERDAVANGNGDTPLADLRLNLLTLMSRREQSGLYDPSKGSVDDQIATMKTELDPIESNYKMLVRAENGLSLLKDAWNGSFSDETDSNAAISERAEPFSSFVMHPDMPDVPVAGAKGFLYSNAETGEPEALHMTLFGSVNMVEGAGTVVMADFLTYAAEKGVRVVITHPTSDAKSWYEGFGFAESGGSSNSMILNDLDVKDWVAAYKAASEGAK